MAKARVYSAPPCQCSTRSCQYCESELSGISRRPHVKGPSSRRDLTALLVTQGGTCSVTRPALKHDSPASVTGDASQNASGTMMGIFTDYPPLVVFRSKRKPRVARLVQVGQTRELSPGHAWPADFEHLT
jgi:hypothetical protein